MTKQEIKAWVRLQNNINMQKTFDTITTNLRPLDKEILSRFIIEKDTIKNITEWLNSELNLNLTVHVTSRILDDIRMYLQVTLKNAVELGTTPTHHTRWLRKLSKKMGKPITRFVPTNNAPATPHTIVEKKTFIGDICTSRTIVW